MKTKRSILLAILLGMLFTVSTKARENEAVQEAAYDLKHNISRLFKAFPWEDLVGPDECCTVVISFRVNDELLLEDIQVKGENNDLVQYTMVALNREKIIAEDVLKGKKYRMQIKFDNKG